jgi:hypothetical protein
MPTKRSTVKETVVPVATPARRKTSTTTRTRKTTAVATPAQADAVPVAAVAPTIEAVPYQPTAQEIAALAYSYWEARGYQAGSPETDWFRAEAELRARG